MWCSLEFYASEIVGFLKDISEPGVLDYIEAIAPVCISILALIVSHWGKSNTEAIQKKIATSEDRASKRTILLEVYSEYLNFETITYIEEGFFRIPNDVRRSWVDLTKKKIDMNISLNKVKLILMGDKSELSANLISSIRNAFLIYIDLYDAISEFIDNGECDSRYKRAMDILHKKYGLDIEDHILLSNRDVRQEFLSLSNCQKVNDIYGLKEKYLSAISDGSFDINFKKYFDALSK